MSTLKTTIYNHCIQNVQQMVLTAQQSIKRAEESIRSETKSSVGDKFETGRAMAHAEMHKAQRSLAEAKLLLTNLHTLDVETIHERVQRGSLVETNAGFYFLSIGLGKLILEDETYYVLSVQSPLGKLFLNKTVGDEFTFRSLRVQIIAIQ